MRDAPGKDTPAPAAPAAFLKPQATPGTNAPATTPNAGDAPASAEQPPAKKQKRESGVADVVVTPELRASLAASCKEEIPRLRAALAQERPLLADGDALPAGALPAEAGAEPIVDRAQVRRDAWCLS